jgi:hypothetical protein
MRPRSFPVVFAIIMHPDHYQNLPPVKLTPLHLSLCRDIVYCNLARPSKHYQEILTGSSSMWLTCRPRSREMCREPCVHMVFSRAAVCSCQVNAIAIAITALAMCRAGASILEGLIFFASCFPVFPPLYIDASFILKSNKPHVCIPTLISFTPRNIFPAQSVNMATIQDFTGIQYIRSAKGTIEG